MEELMSRHGGMGFSILFVLIYIWQCHLVKLVSTNFVAVLTLGTAILVVSKT